MDDREFEEKVALCAYKPLSEINDGEWRLLEIEKNRCQSFIYFLKYGRIIQPPSMDTTGGVIQMQILPHLKKLIASPRRPTFKIKKCGNWHNNSKNTYYIHL